MIESSVRNSREIGENLQKIVKRLMTNEKLVKLLFYTDKDPLSHDIEDMIAEYGDYETFCQKVIFEKLIKIVPRVGPKDTAQSLISIRVVQGSKNYDNNEFRDIDISIEVFVPLTQWIIKDTNLRPFMILGEIENSLEGKTINGLGKIVGGDFAINFLTDEISCYEQNFKFIQYG